MELQAQEMLIAGVLAVVLLLLLMQFVVLIKITQIQNNQKHKQSGNNPANNGQKHVSNQNQNQNQNKKHDSRPNQNQNNNRPAQQNQPNQNKQQQGGGEKKFDKIASNAQSLKETNTQLSARPKPQQQQQQQNGKPKVYSERTGGNNATTASGTTAPSGIAAQKQERPANAPIKQQELPKSEENAEKQQVIAAEKTTEPVTEVKTEHANSVQYGRR